MTPEAQRIAIAKACGWKWQPKGDEYGPLVYPWKLPDGSRHPGLDFVNDLNAMHEAEKTLNHPCEASYKYIDNLKRICGWIPWHATAAQRAEAFLRTIGKWQDEKA